MSTRSEAFRQLHSLGPFVIPNPWDRGSARILEELGFQALATTSAGLGRSLGKDDQEVTRDELVAHVDHLAGFVSVPLNVDSERLFPTDPGGIAETIRLLANAGAAGCSIEDYDPLHDAIDEVGKAADAVAEAAAACRDHGLVLTARAENHLYGVTDLDDTIARLSAYRDAGAEVVYAPGLRSAEQIERVMHAVGVPINVLSATCDLSVEELAALGVHRISTGGALYSAAYRTLREHAAALRLAD